MDFLPVGDGERGGDAIAFRYGNLHGPRNQQVVVVIDGGTRESGAAVVTHVRKHFGTNEIDLVISTHPDSDHTSGLRTVIEECQVEQLWMHKPWEHSEDIVRAFRDGRITDDSIERRLRKSLATAHDLQDVANMRGVKITEPFTGLGLGNGEIVVLGPTRSYYEGLLPDFRDMPQTHEDESLLERILKAGRDAVERVRETLHVETLTDEGRTSAENNSSAVVLFRPSRGHYLLFTADAGIPALAGAIRAAATAGVDLRYVELLQVPHHGSRRNIGPVILDNVRARLAVISAPKEGSPKHPAKKVINALIRRQALVYATCGNALRHSRDAPPRYGWTAAEQQAFSEFVEV